MTRFFIDRPIVAMVISILFVLGGLIAMRSLSIAQYPQITPPQISITSTYLGADAITVESAVAAPIEQQMNGVQDMLYMQSTNASDGTMTLRIVFDIASDINMDNVLAQNRLTAATPFLPPDVRALGIVARNVSVSPLLVVAIYSTDNRYPPDFLSNYVTINMRDPVLRVPGVGDFRILGAADYAMRIWVKPDQLTQLGITVTDLRNAILAQNVVNPAGQIGAEPAPQGTEFTYSARAQGRLVTP
jgi:HAE1 family hydrophobic/amphiphilic exporter-1